MRWFESRLKYDPTPRVRWHVVSHFCTIVLMLVMLWSFKEAIQREHDERIVAETKANACLATAKQCDAELVTCIGWQARVSFELGALLDRECGL